MSEENNSAELLSAYNDANAQWLVALAQQIVKLSGVSLASALLEAEEHMFYGRENADYGGRLVI